MIGAQGSKGVGLEGNVTSPAGLWIEHQERGPLELSEAGVPADDPQVRGAVPPPDPVVRRERERMRGWR